MKKYILSFLFILLLGFAVRIYNLPTIPAGFFCDEASIGYNAYLILTTGTDEWGAHFPVFFKAFGEYKSPVQIYSTIPSLLFFGMNEFAVRLTSVIYGMLCLVAIYFLVKELFKGTHQDKRLALLAMFFLAIAPWHIHFSRVAYEMMPFVFFTMLGLMLFLKAQNMPRLLPLAVITLTLALYSYFVGRLFIPLFGLGLCIIYFRFFLSHKRETIMSLLLLIVLLIPFIQNLLSPVGLARWQQINVFSQPPKNETVTQLITTTYLKHFSPDFLFLKGDIGMPERMVTRDSVGGMGELYLFQLPLLLCGVYALMKKRNKTFFVLLLWLGLYPVGSMFDANGLPFARRSIIGVVPFQIVTAVGSLFLLQSAASLRKPNQTWRKLFYFGSISIALVVIICSFFNYLFLYFVSYPLYSSGWWGWQYGPKEIIAYFSTHEASYDDLIMAPYFNAPYIFFRFYAPRNCSKCQIGLPEGKYAKNRKQLYALPPSYLSNSKHAIFHPVKTINYPNGQPAFILTTLYTQITD